MSGERGAEATEYDTPQQDLVDMSSDNDAKQEQITKQKQALLVANI